jgi:hypothetical protein
VLGQLSPKRERRPAVFPVDRLQFYRFSLKVSASRISSKVARMNRIHISFAPHNKACEEFVWLPGMEQVSLSPAPLPSRVLE